MSKNFQMAFRAGRQAYKGSDQRVIKWLLPIAAIGIGSVLNLYLLPWYEIALAELFLVVIPTVVWLRISESRR